LNRGREFTHFRELDRFGEFDSAFFSDFSDILFH